MASKKLRLAISTCPNDTYAFHAILNNKIDLDGFEFEIELLDIEELNQGLFADRFDVAKASMHAALYLTRNTVVLPVGAALGFGVGPLLLSNQPIELDSAGQLLGCKKGKQLKALCPGEFTTASFLFRTFVSTKTDLEQSVFSSIMPALQSGEVDLGVCIHEGRYTWAEKGLHCVADLGTLWEVKTKQPLPLGGILARRELGHDQLGRLAAVIRRSIEYANSNRQETLPTMRAHAQEFSDAVLLAHVDLYVNEWTINLGKLGRSALEALSTVAKEKQLVDSSVSLAIG